VKESAAFASRGVIQYDGAKRRDDSQNGSFNFVDQLGVFLSSRQNSKDSSMQSRRPDPLKPLAVGLPRREVEQLGEVVIASMTTMVIYSGESGIGATSFRLYPVFLAHIETIQLNRATASIDKSLRHWSGIAQHDLEALSNGVSEHARGPFAAKNNSVVLCPPVRR